MVQYTISIITAVIGFFLNLMFGLFLLVGMGGFCVHDVKENGLYVGYASQHSLMTTILKRSRTLRLIFCWLYTKNQYRKCFGKKVEVEVKTED